MWQGSNFPPGVLDDFDRSQALWDKFEVTDAADRIQEIIAALYILRSSPLVGRPARGGKRELVAGGRSRGYIALQSGTIFGWLPVTSVMTRIRQHAQNEFAMLTIMGISQNTRER